MDQIIVPIGYAALGVVIVWVLHLTVTFVRENAPPKRESAPKPPRRFELRHTIDLSDEAIARLGVLLDQSRHTTVLHELGPDSVADLRTVLIEVIERQAQAARDAQLPVMVAQPIAMPPQPEERIARDMKHARAISRGAAQLMQQATRAGLGMTMDEALEQAALMYNRTQTEDAR